MKKSISAFFVCLAVWATAWGQKDKTIEPRFAGPIQVDSSQYYLIPRLLDAQNSVAYGNGKGYLPWGHYADILFYNAATNQSKKLFDGQLALIQPFDEGQRSYNDDRTAVPANLLPNHIVYLARTDNFNGDNGLDGGDPLYLYLSTKTGEQLTQITPKGLNVVSWTLSKDKKMILVKMNKGNTGNKKADSDDGQLFYRIDLHTDISKVRCYPIAL
jgi:hypothetical protein